MWLRPAGSHYELRTKSILTAVGQVEILRSYNVCPSCPAGQCPADAELDIEKTEFSVVSAAFPL